MWKKTHKHVKLTFKKSAYFPPLIGTHVLSITSLTTILLETFWDDADTGAVVVGRMSDGFASSVENLKVFGAGSSWNEIPSSPMSVRISFWDDSDVRLDSLPSSLSIMKKIRQYKNENSTQIHLVPGIYLFGSECSTASIDSCSTIIDFLIFFARCCCSAVKIACTPDKLLIAIFAFENKIGI